MILVIAFSITGVVSATQHSPPYAMNYDFSDIPSTPTASNAENYQDQIGYNGYSYTDQSVISGTQWLSDSSIYFFNGHGGTYQGDGGGILVFQDSNGSSSYLFASDVPDDLMSTNHKVLSDSAFEINDVLLMVLEACYSANYNSETGNLLSTASSKGVDYRIGFSGAIGNGRSNYWGNKFWEYLEDGYSIGYSASTAVNDAIDDIFPWGWTDGVDTIVVQGNSPSTAYLTPVRYGTI